MTYGNVTWTLWLLNLWNIWKYQGEKSNISSWVGVAKWVASFWSSPPCQDAFLSFPATPEIEPRLFIRSNLLLSQSSASVCVFHMQTGLIDKERSRDGGGAYILLQRDNTFPFPDLNPHFFPNTWSLAWSLEKEMATHSSILSWEIQWTEEPGRLQSMGSQRVRHDWVPKTTTKTTVPFQPHNW